MNKKAFCFLSFVPLLLGSCSYSGDTKILLSGHALLQDEYKLTEDSFSIINRNIKEKNSFCLYLSLEGCAHCNAFTPALEKVTSDLKLLVFHLDRTKDSEEIDKLFAAYPEYTTNEFPTFYVVNQGKPKTLEYAKINSKTRLKNTLRKEISLTKHYYFYNESDEMEKAYKALDLSKPIYYLQVNLENPSHIETYQHFKSLVPDDEYLFIYDSTSVTEVFAGSKSW